MRTKTAHTPRPWNCYPRVTDGNTYDIWDADDNMPQDMSLSVMNANARLIAAAPELLEALELFCPCDPLTPSHAERVSERELMAWAAIQKARGL